MRIRWKLYVDESGDFSNRDQAVAVAGWLVRRDNPAARPDALLRSLLPLAPEPLWPFHHRDLNFAAAWAIGALAAQDQGLAVPEQPGLPSLAALGTSLHASVRGMPMAVLFKSWRRSPHGSWEGAHQGLRTLDSIWRDTSPEDYASALAWVRAHEGRVSGLLRQVRAEALATPDCLLVAAGETARGDAVPPPRGATTDRYLGVLGCLLQRVRALLDRVDGTHEVEVDVLDRTVSWRGREARLTSDILVALADSVAVPLGERTTLRFVVSRWEPGLAPGLVVADFLANRARRMLESNASLQTVENAARATTGLATRAGVPPRSALAATGGPWAWVVDLAERLAPLPLRPVNKRWVVDQAREWS